MRIHVQTDQENDLVYLSFSERSGKAAVARTAKVDDDLNLDFDAAGRLLGLEIMNASRRIDGSIDQISVDSIVGVKEAAALAGVHKSNFVRDYANKPDFPKPIADLGTGRFWLSSQVEEYLSKGNRVRDRSLPASVRPEALEGRTPRRLPKPHP